jgi:hypothetical protein
MANHVDNFITVIGNEAATAEFERIFSSVFSDDKGLRDAEFLPRDEDGQVDMNSIGAKWAYVEDVSNDYASVTSAWSAVLPFVEHLGDHLMDFDSEVKVTCKFTDEGWGFVGAAVYDDHLIDSEEEYYEDLVESRLAYLASNGEEVLKDSEDEDSEDEEYDPWEDDGWYDWIDTRQDMILSDLLESCDDVAQ